jgi:hypothetical protein
LDRPAARATLDLDRQDLAVRPGKGGKVLKRIPVSLELR